MTLLLTSLDRSGCRRKETRRRARTSPNISLGGLWTYRCFQHKEQNRVVGLELSFQTCRHVVHSASPFSSRQVWQHLLMIISNTTVMWTVSRYHVSGWITDKFWGSLAQFMSGRCIAPPKEWTRQHTQQQRQDCARISVILRRCTFPCSLK